MPGYKKITKPSKIPVLGNKIIEEYFGRLNTGHEKLSVAHMIAPPGWTEPAQTPDFDEVTILLSGKMSIKIEEEKLTLSAGEVILVEKGNRVQYENPFEEEAELWSICMPAFSPELVNRDVK